MTQPMRFFKETARRVLAQGRRFDFFEIDAQTPSGRTVHKQGIHHPGAVIILPILDTPSGPTLVLERNDRVLVGQSLLELPAGTREPGEDPATTAGRELVEETGYQAATCTELCRFYTSPGLSDELMWAFVARQLTHVGQHLEPDEGISVELIHADHALELIDAGQIVDAKSILTLLFARRKGLL